MSFMAGCANHLSGQMIFCNRHESHNSHDLHMWFLCKRNMIGSRINPFDIFFEATYSSVSHDSIFVFTVTFYHYLRFIMQLGSSGNNYYGHRLGSTNSSQGSRVGTTYRNNSSSQGGRVGQSSTTYSTQQSARVGSYVSSSSSQGTRVSSSNRIGDYYTSSSNRVAINTTYSSPRSSNTTCYTC